MGIKKSKKEVITTLKSNFSPLCALVSSDISKKSLTRRPFYNADTL